MRYGCRAPEPEERSRASCQRGLLPYARGRKNHRLSITILSAAVLCASLMLSCGEHGEKRRYEAEKSLFRSRKMMDELTIAAGKPEFLDKTIRGYKELVNEFRGEMDEVEGMDEIVVTAQMELAELEFRAGMLKEARDDFVEAEILAKNFPPARANALYSAAFISEQMGDPDKAETFYEKLHSDFLDRDRAMETAAMESRYLVAPIKLAELCLSSGYGEGAAKWLVEAENLYRYLADNSDDPGIVKEARFNLLTVYLRGKRWRTAMEKTAELKDQYRESADRTSLLFLEAKILDEGMSMPGRALEVYSEIYTDFPESNEAVASLLAAGGILMREGKHGRAESIYGKVVEYPGVNPTEASEAAWKLAAISESKGNWIDASLRYKSVYTNYPGTIYAFEAPIHIANHYRDNGEEGAAVAAYRRAADYYKGLASDHSTLAVKVMAEQYGVRTMIEQGLWEEAAGRLLELPDEYPEYLRFRDNYIMAASIFDKELNDKERAAEILLECIERYTGTGIAAEAEKRLEQIRR